MNESDLYVDSEEDEVFFGSINEKEMNITCKLVNDLGWNSASEKQYTRISEGNNENKNSLRSNVTNDYVNKKNIIADDISSGHARSSIDLNQSKAGHDDSLDNEEYHSIHSNNTSVELDHNYSYTKQKIDESILATPKSVVKADKDGGFLKVLSEIALVKAEADNKMESDKMVGESNNVKVNEDDREGEDKENKMGPIPELRVIEATPEKHFSKSPQQGIKLQTRKFKLVYNSPQSDADGIGKQSNKSKSFTETETQIITRNSGKKSWNKYVCMDEKSSVSQSESGIDGTKKSRGNSWPNSACDRSINLTQEESPSTIVKCNDDAEGDSKKANSILKSDNSIENNSNEIMLIELDCSPLDVKKVTNIAPQSQDDVEEVLVNIKSSPMIKKADENKMESSVSESESQAPELLCEPSLITTKTIDCHEPPIICLDDTESCDATLESKSVVCLEPDNAQNNETEGGQLAGTEENEKDTLVEMLKNTGSSIAKAETSFISPGIKNLSRPELSRKYRFSKEARKIVEALKISTSDDTLNFTIPEINLEEMENSFLTSESVAGLDDNTLDKKTCLKSPALSTILDKVPDIPSTGLKNVSKENPKSVGGEKKYFSDRKILVEKKQTDGSEVKKCVRRLPIFDRTPHPAKGMQSCERKLESKIPVSGLKPSKIPSSCHLGSKLGSHQPSGLTPLRGPAGDCKGNPSVCKTPSGSGQKSTKYRNIASPISAYIHNKPTILVLNVKSQVKKDGTLNVMKAHAKANSVEKPEKPACNELGLPFVEYKSATPYKIEKCPKSRLPRLAPTMQKLIGPHSPRILKHKGRFYMKTPAGNNGSSADATVLADHNEVSLVVSEVAQKSSSRK